MVLNPCLMVLNHFMINLKQISLYSSISKHILIGILIFSWNMPAASQRRENQSILWHACTATTNLYSKVLILLVNATNNTYSLYKLMLSLLWEINKSFVTAIKRIYQMLLFWEGKTQTSPSYLGFELPIRVSLLGFFFLEKPYLLYCQLKGLCVCCYISVSLFIILNSLSIIFSSLNLSWYVWSYHIFTANKWKFSNHFFIDFFIGKTKSRCPISCHLLLITGGYSSLLLSVSISFVLLSQLFRIPIVVQRTCWQYSTTKQ